MKGEDGKLARNMRLALPNASFIGFTGTPLSRQDELTRRIFGDYVPRYDLERLRDEFAKTKRRNTALQDVREVVEQRLAQMLAENPLRMDFNQKYQEIIADYN